MLLENLCLCFLNRPLPFVIPSFYTRSVTCHTPHSDMRGGQRGGWWIKDGLDGFLKWNTGWMKRAIDRGARLRTQQRGGKGWMTSIYDDARTHPQRGGRVLTLHERHFRRVLHGSKKQKKKSGVTARKRKKRSRRTGIM